MAGSLGFVPNGLLPPDRHGDRVLTRVHLVHDDIPKADDGRLARSRFPVLVPLLRPLGLRFLSIPPWVTRLRLGCWTCEIGRLAEADEPSAVPLDPASQEALVGFVPKDSILCEDVEPGIIGQQDGVIPDPG